MGNGLLLVVNFFAIDGDVIVKVVVDLDASHLLLPQSNNF